MFQLWILLAAFKMILMLMFDIVLSNKNVENVMFLCVIN